MEITAAMVKELRSQSGAGIMECKSALKETQGDLEEAITFLRKKGLAKAFARAVERSKSIRDNATRVPIQRRRVRLAVGEGAVE